MEGAVPFLNLLNNLRDMEKLLSMRCALLCDLIGLINTIFKKTT